MLPRLIGHPHLVEWLRQSLNDQTLFPREAPRTYLYSEADKMVPWHDVERHRAAAKEAGYVAEAVKFQRSPHVAHVTEDEGRYWGAIDDVQHCEAL